MQIWAFRKKFTLRFYRQPLGKNVRPCNQPKVRSDNQPPLYIVITMTNLRSNKEIKIEARDLKVNPCNELAWEEARVLQSRQGQEKP